MLPPGCYKTQGQRRFTARELVFPMAVEAALFGMYTVLMTVSISALRYKCPRSRAEVYLTLVIGSMFFVALVHFAGHLINIANSIEDDIICSLVPSSVHNLLEAMSDVQLINWFLSDAIVVWRAWVLWNRSKLVMTISTGLALVTIAVYIVKAVLCIDPHVDQAANGNITLVALGLSALNNLWGTLLVTYKTWMFRKSIRDDPATGIRTTSVAVHALVIITESGVVYLLVLIVAAEFELLGALSKMFPKGLYPTIVILLVYREKAQLERILLQSTIKAA
ncbi:hypothetical protein OF83DRAFT_1176658 [Amylostereum chailletii]|nr:hypothetical protein OF83DRAFT_1176658 [Amylostereum chailletii]